MKATIPRLREQLALFDADEIRQKLVKADIRLRTEARLPEIRSRYDIDANTALLILDEAVAAGDDEDEVAFALEGIAASWVGESDAWLEAARRVDARLGEKGVSLAEVVGRATTEMAKIMGRGVPSEG